MLLPCILFSVHWHSLPLCPDSTLEVSHLVTVCWQEGSQQFNWSTECIFTTLDIRELPATKIGGSSKTWNWHCEREEQMGLNVRKGETMNECLIPAKSRRAASLCSTNHVWPHDQTVALIIPSFHVFSGQILWETCGNHLLYLDTILKWRCCTLATKLSAHFHTGLCEDSQHNGSTFITLLVWLLSWCWKCILLLITSLIILFSFRTESSFFWVSKKVRLTKMVFHTSVPECPIVLLWKSLINWGWPWITDPLVCTSWLPLKLLVWITADS